MHPEADRWCEQTISEHGPWDGARVLDVGGRDVNGTARTHLHRYADVRCHVVDIRDSDDVDYLADVRGWEPPRSHHLVLCTEVLEHVQGWPSVCWTLYRAAMPGGLVLITCASTGRAAHNATDGGMLPPGEWYQNVDPDALAFVMDACGFVELDIDTSHPGDVYAVARRP